MGVRVSQFIHHGWFNTYPACYRNSGSDTKSYSPITYIVYTHLTRYMRFVKQRKKQPSMFKNRLIGCFIDSIATTSN